MPIGPHLRDLREQAGLSQADVADAYGISQSMISKFENGQRPIEEERDYQRFLERLLRPSDERPPLSVLKEFDTEGPRLFSDEVLHRKLPGEWILVGVTRCGSRHELAFVHEPVRDVTGFCAFYRNSSGELKRTSVIPMEPQFHRHSTLALLRFLSGHYAGEDVIGLSSPDDADDDEVVPGKANVSLKRGGWEQTVLDMIRKLGKTHFVLDEVYDFEPKLQKIFPDHVDIRSGTRFTLQRLRDRGLIKFLGGGRYRLLE